MMWPDLWAAIALLLIFEGIMPVAGPHFYRRRLLEVAQLPDAVIRLFGLFSLIGGALLLYWVRHAH